MRLLLLAGTDEARQLAGALAPVRGLTVIATMARPERPPRPFGVPARIGRFGGEAAYRTFLDAEGIEAILDATHPFARLISRRAASIAAETRMPYVRLLRPPWQPGPGDDWRFAHDMADVARHVPKRGALLVTAGQGIEALAPVADRPIYLRGGTVFPFERGGQINEQPQGSLEGEETMMRRLGIACLVAENTGGGRGRTALDVARRLALPVVMIRRPLQPETVRVTSLTAAISWVRRLV